MIAPPHLLFHWPASEDPAYYEVVCPEIFRVGLNPGATLRIHRGQAKPKPDTLKRFEYVVMGDASEIEGLAAPFAEEDTGQIMLLEQLTPDLDFFTFWYANKNTDLVTGRTFENRQIA
jgi:hypothetical protein